MSDPLRILFLEDDENDAILIAHELKRADFNIDWVRVDTKQDFEEQLKNKPDLILADYSLPQYDALSALKLVKEMGLDIPLIVISGAITEETAVRFIKEGANDYLLKDRLARLPSAVQQALDEHRLRAEKQKAEHALSESEAKYRSLFVESREGILTTDLDGVITECNPAFEELIGFRRDELLGQNLSDFLLEQNLSDYLYVEPGEEDLVRNAELEMVHKHGQTIYVLFTGSLMRDQDGEPQLFLGIVRDITERKRGQRELEVVVDVNAALRTASNRKTMVPIAAEIIRNIAQADGVIIVLEDPVSGALQVEGVNGIFSELRDVSIHLDEKVMAEIMDSGVGRRWTDPFNAPELVIELPSLDLNNLVCLPMTSNQVNVGLVWYTCPQFCTDEVFSLSQVAANIVANAILRTTLNENNIRSLQESEALANISRILNQNLNLETIFAQIVREAVAIIPEASRSVIHLYDEKMERLHPVAMGWIEKDHIETKSLIRLRVGPSNEFDFGVLNQDDIELATMRSGKGAAGLVIKTGEPLIIDEAETDDRFLKSSQDNPIKSIVVAPILSGNLRLGTLSVLGDRNRSFNERDKNLVERLCLQASIAIENARLLEAERLQRELAESQAEISSLLNQSLELDEVLVGILNHTLRFFDAGAAKIMLVVDDRLEMARQIGYRKADIEAGQLSFTLEGLADRYPSMYQAYQTGEKILIRDTQNDPNWVYEEASSWIRSYICIPLKANEKVIGLLNLDSARADAFDDLVVHQLTSFANTAAAAVENARLYTDLEQSLATEQATRFQLMRADKLAGMGRMVASVAHELNNPLQTIKNCLFLIEQSYTSEEDMDLLELSLSEVERLTSIVNRLRDVYLPANRDGYQLTALTEMIMQLEKLLETHLKRNQVVLSLEDLTPYQNIYVSAYPDQLKQVFLNLSLNAIEAMQPEGGNLTIKIKPDWDRQQVGISFSDTGSGIHEDELKIVFDPFYTTKEAGMGLGLSICYDIMQNHDGSIEVENNPDEGVTFTVWMPLQEKPVLSPEADNKIRD
jgi:PAS domain S-box-containing protein